MLIRSFSYIHPYCIFSIPPILIGDLDVMQFHVFDSGRKAVMSEAMSVPTLLPRVDGDSAIQ